MVLIVTDWTAVSQWWQTRPVLNTAIISWTDKVGVGLHG